MTDPTKALRDAREAIELQIRYHTAPMSYDRDAAMAKSDAALKAIDAALAHQAEHAEAGEAVAWQERQRITMTQWSDWYECKGHPTTPPFTRTQHGITYEWRPLYAAPQPSQATQPADLPDDATLGDLWAEIHRLRAAVKGPDGYASWQDAAVAERVRRVRAEQALSQASEPPQQGEPLRGWKFNDCRKSTDDDGVWELGWYEEEGDYFSPIVRVDTGLYFQDADAEPLARAIFARLVATPPASEAPTWTQEQIDANVMTGAQLRARFKAPTVASEAPATAGTDWQLCTTEPDFTEGAWLSLPTDGRFLYHRHPVSMKWYRLHKGPFAAPADPEGGK